MTDMQGRYSIILSVTILYVNLQLEHMCAAYTQVVFSMVSELQKLRLKATIYAIFSYICISLHCSSNIRMPMSRFCICLI